MNNNQFTFLDTLNVLSFYVGMLNLEQNLTQNDKQEIENTFTQQLNAVLVEIHNHLEQQDEKINMILKRLEEK